MLHQGRRTDEGFRTLAASVGLFSGVTLPVPDELGAWGEGSAADLPLVGLLPAVDSLLVYQGRGAPEGLPALAVSGVGALMLREVGHLAEGPSALSTGVGLLARVEALVLGEVGPLVEGFAALAALIGSPSRVDPWMLDAHGAAVEGFPTLVAPAAFLFSMDFLTDNEVRHGTGSFSVFSTPLLVFSVTVLCWYVSSFILFLKDNSLLSRVDSLSKNEYINILI